VSSKFILPSEQYDLNKVLLTQEELRSFNPQRFEMEQLTAVVYEDTQTHTIVGYLDLTGQEFWVRGHMPNFALMPGVLQCEAAAQLASVYSQRNGLLSRHPNEVLGFGGIDEVRFRGIVRPGDRLVVVAHLEKVRPKIMSVWRFQCLVKDAIVCEGLIKGVVLTLNQPLA